MAISLDELKNYLENTWFEKTGLAIALIMGAFTIFITIEDPIRNWLPLGTFIIIWSVIVTAAWLYFRKPQKTVKGNIGFIVCIDCMGDGEAQKIKEDFILPLQKNLGKSSDFTKFQFIEIPQRIAKTINNIEDARTLRKKCKGHFIVFGSVKLRVVGGTEKHILELDGLVGHAQITEHQRKPFQQDLAGVFPSSVHIDKENDFASFQFTSEWTVIVADYMIGVAAALSQDLDYAKSLLNLALSELSGKDHDFPAYQKLKTRIPKRLREIQVAHAGTAFAKWEKDKTEENLRDFVTQAEQLDIEIPDPKPDELNLSSICAFLDRRDTDRCISIQKQIRTKEATWFFNLAFLYGYEGNLQDAYKNYRKGSNAICPPEVYGQIETFICWVLEVEPNQSQLHYCLGLFNKMVKGDKQAAIQDFELFLHKTSENEYKSQRKVAQQWISELKTQVS